MQPLDLNLATRPFRNNTLLWTGYGVASLLFVVFIYWNVTSFYEHRRLLRESQDETTSAVNLRHELNKRNVDANRATKTEYDIPGLEAQAEKANEVIEWKAFSWTKLFNRMEQAQPWNVRLASIRPVFRGERGQGGADLSGEGRKSMPVVVEGSAQNFEALLNLERALFDDPHFDRPEPDRTNNAENGEVVFTLRFTYYPDSLEELGADAPQEEAGQEAEAALEDAGDADAVAVDADVDDADAVMEAVQGAEPTEVDGSDDESAEAAATPAGASSARTEGDAS